MKASIQSRQQAIRTTLAQQTSSNFGGNKTFENSSVFDENSNDKVFIGSKISSRSRHTQHRISRKIGVEHKGNDLKEHYTLGMPTLFNTVQNTFVSKKTEIKKTKDGRRAHPKKEMRDYSPIAE